MGMYRAKPRMTRVDRRSALSRGLTRALLFRSGSGLPVDSVTGERAVGSGGTWRVGGFGPALAFDKTESEHVDIGTFSFGSRFTIAALGTSPGKSESVLGSTSTSGRRVAWNSSGKVLEINTGAGLVYNSVVGGELDDAAPTLNVWVKRDDTAELYRNGVLWGANTDANNAGPVTLDQPVMLGGRRNQNTSRKHGDVTYDMVAIWNARALDPWEIGQLSADPFVLFRHAWPVSVFAPGPRAGWRVYGGVGGLGEVDLATPIASVEPSSSEVTIAPSHRPAAGERATYVVRRADAAGRVERGVGHVHTLLDAGALKQPPWRPAWPYTPGWTPTRADDAWTISAAWGARLDTLGVRDVQLVRQIQGEAEAVIETDTPPQRTSTWAFTTTPLAAPVRYKVRAVGGDGSTADSPWSCWLNEVSPTPTTVAPLNH